jgi:two-component system, OmpR family, alkaline phosphatase synthesis response regulator PhoP
VLLRRTSVEADSHGVLAAGPIELDVDRYVAAVDGQPVALTAKEFHLLRTLIEARGRVVRREAALERVWNHDRDGGIESRTLDVHIRRLRKKLGSAGSRIMTIRNVGYRMNIAPAWTHPPSTDAGPA